MGRRKKEENKKCKVKFTTNSCLAPDKSYLVSYTGEGGMRMGHWDTIGEIEVPKGTTIFVINWSAKSECDKGAQQLYYNNKNAIYRIIDNAVLTYIY